MQPTRQTLLFPLLFCDAALEYLITNSVKMYICDREPKTYGEVVDRALAVIDIKEADIFTGPLDYYGSGEEVLGRMLVVLAVDGIGSKDGGISHVALTGVNGLLFVVRCESGGEILENMSLIVKDWCIVIEYAEGDCTIPEGYID